MRRILRTTSPCAPGNFVLKWPNLIHLAGKEKVYKNKMKKCYDRRRRSKIVNPLNPGDNVWIKKLRNNQELSLVILTHHVYI